MSVLRTQIKQDKPFADPSHEALLSLIRAAAVVREHIESVCRVYGLSFSQYNVLRILRGGPDEGYPRSAIIERVLDPMPDVTRIIDVLLKAGFVRRERCGDDRRVVRHWITPAGVRHLAEMQADLDAVHEQFGSAFSPSELSALTELTGRVLLTPLQSSEPAPA